MTDYAKRTVKELQELLSAKGLTVSGKKAELIARLQEADKSTGDQPAAPSQPQSSTTTSQPTKDAPPPPAAESKATTKPTQAVPSTTTTTEPSAPIPASATLAQDVRESSATTDTKLAAAVSYSMNLPTSSLDDELKKRKARAERFGTGAAPANGSTEAEATGPDAEALKALERAKKFGATDSAMGKLDEALPAERERGGRKRGRADEENTTSSGVYDDPGLKAGRGGMRRFNDRGRGRGGRVGGGPDRPQGVVKTSANAFSSEKDRLAAEARKKKFGA